MASLLSSRSEPREGSNSSSWIWQGVQLPRGPGVSGTPAPSLAWHLGISSWRSEAQAQGLRSLPELSPPLCLLLPRLSLLPSPVFTLLGPC